MKALTIQPARGSQRAILPAIMAAVSYLVQRATLPTAIVATVCLIACLGLTYVPGIVTSGLVSLICCAIAPVDKNL